uniref:Prominin-like protein n=4 Tax=Parascaris univalens TaxID=6257 RepID=A0A915BVR9_PARUN
VPSSVKGGNMAINLRWQLPSLLLSLLFVVVVGGQSFVENECAGFPPAISSYNGSYGGIANLYQFAGIIANRLQPSLSEDDIARLANVYNENFNNISTEDATYFIKKQTTAIVILAVCVLFIVGLPVAGICFCSFRGCGKCGAAKDQIHSSKWTLSLYILLLIVTLAVIILAMFLYAFSVKNFGNALQTVDEPVDTVIKDVRQMVTFMTDDLSCSINSTLSNLLEHIDDELRILPTQIGEHFKQRIGYHDAYRVIADSNNVSHSLHGSLVSIDEANRILNTSISINRDPSQQMKQRLVSALNTLKHAINKIHRNYNIVIERLKTALSDIDMRMAHSQHLVEGLLIDATRKMSKRGEKIGDFIQLMRSAVDEVLQKGTDGVHKGLLEIHTNLNEHSTMAFLTKGLYVAVLAPSLVIILPAIFVTICVAGRLLLREDIPSERSSCVSFLGNVAIFAVSMVFIVGWIVMLIASFGFLGGYSLEAICHPLFHDDTMRLLKGFPTFSLNITNPLNGQQILLNIGEVLNECRQENTIFTALKGEQFMDIDAKATEYNISAARLQAVDGFRNVDFSFVLPLGGSIHIDEMDDALKFLRESAQNLDNDLQFSGWDAEATPITHHLTLVKVNTLDAANLMSEQLKLLNVVDEAWSNTSDSGMERFIGKHFDDFASNITAYIQQAKDSLLSETLKCRPVYDTWQNVGSVLCGYIGLPAHGIWSSAALAAVCFLPLIILLTQISKYLFRMEPPYDGNVYLYPTISTLHGGSICAYDSGSGTSDVLLVRSNCDISPSRIFPRFASHQRQSSGTFYGYGNNAYNYDTDCERPHLYNARVLNRFTESRIPSTYASNVNDYSPSTRFYGCSQRADNRWWKR